ncbi:MAG TPA: hypothetical protein DCR20_04970, partial [Planctomycetaceae bacterium]|nr:hypothetical protein [Planctomycetaceae bacterium]
MSDIGKWRALVCCVRQCGLLCVAVSMLLTDVGVSAATWQQGAVGDGAAGDNGGTTAVSGPSAEYFEREIRPLLQRRCVECHSTAAASENGDLDLETVEGIAAGGSRGVLFSGAGADGGSGLLLQAVEYANPDLQMPPTGRLPADEIGRLQHWVRSGAQLPHYTAKPRAVAAAIDFESAKQFWSFRPLVSVSLPELAGVEAGVPGNSVDAFIRRGLAERGLQPSPQADRRVLLRRAAFLVTGLPPTPEEQSVFLADESPEWWSRAVDRLLSSPRYGERWARFWLDLVRYT